MRPSNMVQKINLERSFAELEKITQDLQAENLDLEGALYKFERGLQLAAHIKKRLSEIENKIETIKLKFKDTLQEEK